MINDTVLKTMTSRHFKRNETKSLESPPYQSSGKKAQVRKNSPGAPECLHHGPRGGKAVAAHHHIPPDTGCQWNQVCSWTGNSWRVDLASLQGQQKEWKTVIKANWFSKDHTFDFMVHQKKLQSVVRMWVTSGIFNSIFLFSCISVCWWCSWFWKLLIERLNSCIIWTVSCGKAEKKILSIKTFCSPTIWMLTLTDWDDVIHAGNLLGTDFVGSPALQRTVVEVS